MLIAPTLLATLVLAFPNADAPTSPPLPEVISQWTLATIELPKALPESFQITVDLGGTPTTVQFYRYTVRSGNFEVLVDDGSGALTPVEAPEARTYRGSVVGDDGSLVAGSLLEDGLSAMIRVSSGTTWMIEPAARLTPSPIAGDTRHAIYRGSDLNPTDHHCGTDTSGIRIPGLEGEGGIAGATPNWAEIGIETDYEFFQKNSSNVTTTINDIELVMNSVDFIFNRDVNIAYEITVIVVRTAVADPYTSTVIGDRLCEFRNQWNSAPENSIQRDIAHMFSGVSYAGGTIGVAYLGVVCNQSGNNCGGNGNLAYGIVESKYLVNAPLYLRVSLSTHELGHNWEATHCDGAGDPNCHIMCSANNACGGVQGANLKFDPLTINEITSFKNSVSCEPAVTAPLALPFIDQFTTTTLNATRWIYIKGAISSSGGMAEPSSLYSLNLDSLGTNDYQDDEIRSNKILMAGVGNAKFSYFTQHRSVEAGKSLFIDYFNSAGKWTNLKTIVSDGVTQDVYEFSQHQLPTNALHDGFRIRFRTDGDNGTDDWYIDDIRVEQGSACPGDVIPNGTVDGMDLAFLLGFWGTSDPSVDLDDNGVIDGADLAVLLGSWGPCP